MITSADFGCAREKDRVRCSCTLIVCVVTSTDWGEE